MCAYLEDAPNRITYYDGSTWNTLTSEWTTWAPSYTNLTVGNGSVTAVYAYTGMHTVSAFWGITLGSTSAVGSGPQLSLPVAPVTGAQIDSTSLSIQDVSTGPTRIAGRLYFVSGSTVALAAMDSAGTYATLANLSSTVPVTWATGDILSFSMTYRV
jgi:hypothetical protein